MVSGMGFILDPRGGPSSHRAGRQERRDLLAPYLNGEDLNTRPDQSAARFVINFRDWSLDVASSFPHAMRLVETRVKPERLSSKCLALSTLLGGDSCNLVRDSTR